MKCLVFPYSILSLCNIHAGIKFMVIADPKHGGQEALLKRLYEIYADYALKNPFYSIDMPIRWVSDSLKYVQIYKFPDKNTVDRPQQLLGLVNPGDLALDLEFREMTWEFTTQEFYYPLTLQYHTALKLSYQHLLLLLSPFLLW